MKVNGFELVTQEKISRALEGVVTGSGNKVGGIANPDGSYDDDALLAEYDRLGGLIRKGIDKVKTGSFYDFKAKKPRSKPEVSFLFRVNGKEVEVPDGAELPGIVKAARLLAGEEGEAAVGRVKKEVKTTKRKEK